MQIKSVVAGFNNLAGERCSIGQNKRFCAKGSRRKPQTQADKKDFLHVNFLAKPAPRRKEIQL